MASETHGSILLSTADSVSRMLMKKLDSETGFKPSEWTDNINLLGALPIRTASGTIAHFEDGADDVPMKSVVANIVPIQEGTGDPSPSNPRPIIGTSVLNVTRTGKNLFDKSNDSIQINGYISASMIIADNNSLTVFTKCKPNTTYTVSKTAGKRFVVCWYDDVPQVNDTLQGQIADQEASSITITTGATAKYLVAFVFNSSVDTTITKAQMLDSIQVEEGSTSTTYEPYTGSTYPIALGQTVYGGSAEVDEGAGEETLGFVTLDGTEGTWGSSSSYDFCVQIPTMKYGDSLDGLAEWLATWKTSSETKPSVRFGANTTYLYFYNIIGNVSGVTDLASWKIYLANHPLKLAYPLATPTEYTFTGQEINSLEGVNNIWADTGDTEVEYRADIDLLLASLEGNRGLQMMRATPTEENDEQEAKNEGER